MLDKFEFAQRAGISRMHSAPAKAGKSFLRIEFRLVPDDYGVSLRVYGPKGLEIEVDPVLYEGPQRNVLRALYKVSERNAFIVDWERPNDRVYLGEHEYLLWLLKACDNVYDHSGNLLSFADEKARLELQANAVMADGEETGSYQSRLVVVDSEATHYDPVQPLSETFVKCGTRIYEVEPMGEAYASLALFETTFSKTEAEPFLSLFFSYYPYVSLRYADYHILQDTAPASSQACLIFEKIDEDAYLYMRVAQQFPGFDFDFLERYELYKLAFVNNLERSITVRPVALYPLDELAADIQSRLMRHAGGKRELAGIISDGARFILPEHIASAFIYTELPALLEKYTLLGAEQLGKYKVKALQPKLKLSLGSGIDFFEGDASLDFDGEQVSLLDALNQYRQQRYIQLSDGSHAIVNQEYMRLLERCFKRAKNKGKVRLSFFDMPLVAELLEERKAGSVFEKSRTVFEGFGKLSADAKRIPRKVNAKLRPYQAYGFNWLRYLYENKLGGCLADDMGLGKTLQTICLLATVYPEEKKPSIIVMPRSLLYNWQQEFEKFCPEISAVIYHGPQRDIETALQSQVVLSTYATVRNDIELLKEQGFHFAILDESQHIKNFNAQSTTAVLLLNAAYRFALSGTPVENNVADLYPLFRFLNPAMFGSIEEFNKDFVYPIQKQNDKQATDALRAKIFPFILRRLKKDVLTELPDKTEQVLYVDMSEEQRRLYAQRMAYYKNRINEEIAANGIEKAQFTILQGLSELRQLATTPEAKTDGKIVSPKLEVLEESLVNLIANGHKVLVFTNFLAGIESISDMLERIGVGFVSITGATRDRQRLVQRFQQEGDCSVFLATLKTGGLGLNLTAADTVFIYDPWWNIAAENQAVDRAFRMGQTRKVSCYKLIARGSIEEKILLLQEQKRQLFDSLIGADGAAVKSLTAQDIDFILSL